MVFIYGLHLQDSMLVYIGLARLHGIGIPTSISICHKLLIPIQLRFSQLTPSHIASINSYISEFKKRKN